MPPLYDFSGDAGEREYQNEKFALGSLSTITLCHDYICPWCWVGFFQAQKLTEELGVTFDWRSFELIPPGMDYTPAPPKPADPDAPPRPPGRFDLFLEEEGVPLASPRPPFVRSHNALLGAEFAREQGKEVAYHEAVYRAYWERHEDISDVTVLTRLAEGAGLDGAAFAKSVEGEEFAARIVPFDDDSYSLGVRHVPTFIFGAEEKLAEAHYVELKYAAERFLYRRKRLKGKG